MKRILFLSLLLGFILTPFNVKAGTFDVGVEMKNGKVIVEAETVILTTVEVDVEEQEITPTYVVFMNKGNVSFQVIVEDIESGFSNAPSTFVDYNASEVAGKSWENLNELETMTYIAFGISRDGNEFLSILDNGELNLGTVRHPRLPKHGEGEVAGISEYNTKTYQINVKTGFQWDEVENLYYRITYVLEPTYNGDDKPFTGDFVGDVINSNNITDIFEYFSNNSAVLQLTYSNLNVESDVEAFIDYEIIDSNGVKTEYSGEFEYAEDFDYGEGDNRAIFLYDNVDNNFEKEGNMGYLIKVTYRINEKGNLIKLHRLMYIETNEDGDYHFWAFPENMKGIGGLYD